jgi:glycosyltransferase involved in cell wall biosynthesis
VAWPRNVRAEAVSHERFVELLLGAGVVVVPLQDDGHRSAGQQTYLNAMLAEKPVVVTDAMGVREVVTDGVDGIVVPPTAQALRAALERCLSDAARTETAELGRRARETVLRSYTPEDYWRRLVRVVHTPSNGC